MKIASEWRLASRPCDENILQRRNYLLKILLKYGGVLESKNEAITEIEIINHLYDNGDKKALEGF